jgi:hypothetical protein
MTKPTKPRKDNVTRLSRPRSPKRARGWFFAEYDILPYHPRGVVFGQGRADSCVAACCRMLLADYGIEQPEPYLRVALEVNAGAWLSKVPAVLAAFAHPIQYLYRTGMLFADLQAALQDGTAIVYVAHPDSKTGHALLLDSFADSYFAVRDPLPENLGKAYLVAQEDFEKFWLRAKTGRGNAVVVLR